jgi:hypothetical protein
MMPFLGNREQVTAILKKNCKEIFTCMALEKIHLPSMESHCLARYISSMQNNTTSAATMVVSFDA